MNTNTFTVEVCFYQQKLLGNNYLVKPQKPPPSPTKTTAIPAGGQETVKLLQQQFQGSSPKNGLTTEERIQRLLRGGRIR